MKYSPSKKVIATSFVFSIGSILVFGVFIFMILSKISQIKKEALNQVYFLLNAEKSLQIKKELAQISGDKFILDSFFVKTGEEPYFLEMIEKEAKVLGVKANTESVIEGKVMSDGFIPLHISVKYEGGREAVLTFLQHIESLPLSITVDNVNLSVLSDGKSWSALTGITVYKTSN